MFLFFIELAEIGCYLYVESQEDVSGKCTRPNIINLWVNFVPCSAFFRRTFLLHKEPPIKLFVCVINLTTFHAPRLDTPTPTSNGSFYVVKYEVLLSAFRPSAMAMIPTKPYATGTSQSKLGARLMTTRFCYYVMTHI